QERVRDQAEQDVTAKVTVVLKAEAREPRGPGGPPVGRLGGFRVVQHLEEVPCILGGEEDDQHDGGKVAGDEHEVQDHNIDHDDRELVRAAGKGFTCADGEGAHVARGVVVAFVDVLADVDAGNAQSVRH